MKFSDEDLVKIKKPIEFFGDSLRAQYALDLINEVQKLRAENEAGNEALKILLLITCAMHLKPGEDPAWQDCGRWMAIGKAVEEMPQVLEISPFEGFCDVELKVSGLLKEHP
jgi:hypothetical protein